MASRAPIHRPTTPKALARLSGYGFLEPKGLYGPRIVSTPRKSAGKLQPLPARLTGLTLPSARRYQREWWDASPPHYQPPSSHSARGWPEHPDILSYSSPGARLQIEQAYSPRSSMSMSNLNFERSQSPQATIPRRASCSSWQMRKMATCDWHASHLGAKSPKRLNELMLRQAPFVVHRGNAARITAPSHQFAAAMH